MVEQHDYYADTQEIVELRSQADGDGRGAGSGDRGLILGRGAAAASQDSSTGEPVLLGWFADGSTVERIQASRTQAIRALARLARLLERSSDDLNLAHYRVLAAVADGDERASRVAARLALGKPTVSAAVESLTKRGLLARDAAEDDRRAATLTLTPAGETALAGVEREMLVWLDDLCARTPDPDAVLASLAQLGEALDGVADERLAARKAKRSGRSRRERRRDREDGRSERVARRSGRADRCAGRDRLDRRSPHPRLAAAPGRLRPPPPPRRHDLLRRRRPRCRLPGGRAAARAPDRRRRHRRTLRIAAALADRARPRRGRRLPRREPAPLPRRQGRARGPVRPPQRDAGAPAEDGLRRPRRDADRAARRPRQLRHDPRPGPPDVHPDDERQPAADGAVARRDAVALAAAGAGQPDHRARPARGLLSDADADLSPPPGTPSSAKAR